jgi:ATP synthase protein I
LLGRERKLIFRNASKPIRTVLRWQFFATIVFALIAGLLTGIHGAISATLGGLISIAAGLVFAAMISFSKKGTAWGALHAALRAEAVKIGLIVLLIYLVLATYEDVVAVEFIGSFIVSVLIFAMAIAVPEQEV